MVPAQKTWPISYALTSLIGKFMHVQCTLVLFLAFTAVVMLEAPKGAEPQCEAGKSFSYHTIGICTNISICPFFNRANSPPGTKRPSAVLAQYSVSALRILLSLRLPNEKIPACT